MKPAAPPPEISADDFVALVKMLRRGPSLPVTVIGTVSFGAWKCDRNIVFKGVRFTGDFSAENAELRGLTFEYCLFAARLNCSSITISGSFKLDSCQFGELDGEEEAQIKLDCAEIGGSVHLGLDGPISMRTCVIEGDLLIAVSRNERGPAPLRLQVDHSRVRGRIEVNTGRTRQAFLATPNRLGISELSLTGTACGSLTIERTDVERRLDFNMLNAAGDIVLVSVAALEMVGFGCSAGGRLQITAAVDAKPAQSIDLGRASICGQIEINPPGDREWPRLALARLSLRGVTCSTLMVEEVDVRDEIELSGLQASDDLFLLGISAGSVSGYSLTVGNLFMIANSRRFGGAKLRIDGALVLWSAEIKGQLSVGAAGFIGLISLGDCRIGSFRIGAEAAYSGADPPDDVNPTVTAGGFDAFDTHFQSFVQLTRLHVVNPKNETAENPGAIHFQNCAFASDFGCWDYRRPGYSGENTEKQSRYFVGGWESDNEVVIASDFVMKDCKIARSLDLTRLKTGVGEGAGEGLILLDGTSVGGDLRFASPISTGGRAGLPAKAIAAAEAEWARVVADPSRAARNKACAAGLSLVDVEAGSVDLSGLSLNEPNGSSAALAGHIEARRINVRGTMSLYAHRPGKQDEISDGIKYAYAKVPGSVRLDGAHVGELRVTAHSFREPEAAARMTERPISPHSNGLVLEAAEIGVLRVPQLASLCEQTAAGCDAFPVPLDLAGLGVRHWFFTETETGDPCKRADTYLDFLDNDESLHRDVYYSVAATLRNMGEDTEAEKILFNAEYRAERSRESWYSCRGSGRIRPMLGLGLTNAAPRSREISGSSETGPAPAWRRKLNSAVSAVAASAAWSAGAKAGGRVAGGFLTAIRLFATPWKHLFNWVDRVFLRYRRNPIGLALVALFLFILSLPAAMDPRNFELADTARLTALLQCDRQQDSTIDYVVAEDGPMPDPAGWTIGDAIWTSLRYHIPVIGFAVRSDFEPADGRGLRYGLGGYRPGAARLQELARRRCGTGAAAAGGDGRAAPADTAAAARLAEPRLAPRRQPEGLTPEDWFGLMALLNWIIWPLILTFLLRTLLRSD